jgi:hypothetical protein
LDLNFCGQFFGVSEWALRHLEKLFSAAEIAAF